MLAPDITAVTSRHVGQALLLSGPLSFKDAGIANINDTYRGQLYLADGSVKAAIVKDLYPRELANEMLAAALALEFGLPIPPPFLVLARPEVLSARKAPRINEGFLLFASADVKAPSVAQLINADGIALKPICDLIAKIDWLARLYAFDAWAANVDRHVGNILLGGASSVWPIDHGWCFTGRDWRPADLKADAIFRHRLKEWLTPNITEERRVELSGEAASVSGELGTLDIQGVTAGSFADAILSPEDIAALVGFLRDRVPHTPRAAADALGRLV